MKWSERTNEWNENTKKASAKNEKEKRIWWMFIYKMKLHDINEYFGSKPHIYALWRCMYHHASRFFAFSKVDRVPCTHNLFACSWCSSVFSHMLSSSLSTYFFFFLLQFSLRSFLLSPVESGVYISDIQIIGKYKEFKRRKKNWRCKKQWKKTA